ncbi:hypothetical protein [Arthrobacter sp. lap29]|uniref:hypothetical protein n=1 Tax=Arthrobacter sp. lap29 TaxID=3056122 RepID=UPI0028F6F749|nr:hypothetical protein [Arthrobacter sp. lap29]
MRLRSFSVLLVLSFLTGYSLTGCSGTPSGEMAGDPTGDSQLSNGGNGTGGGGVSATDIVVLEPVPDVDIRTVDLNNVMWLFSNEGLSVPYEVKIVNGAAVVDENGFPANYAVKDVSYGDIDGDGDEDAVASIVRTQDNGYKVLWYVWLAQGAEAVQLQYPVAQTSRCGTLVESLVFGDGALNITEYLRIQGKDDSVPCSDHGTGLNKRSITVYTEGAESWPVQSAPVAAWGGLCPQTRWDETSPGVQDLWAAPSKDSPVTATAGPDGGAMFELRQAPLVQRDGWVLIGVKLAGMADDRGATQLQCAWGAS